MAKCNHEWRHIPPSKKDRCIKCNAARPHDPNRCDHEFVVTDGKAKARCKKCGAARPVNLFVHDIVQKQVAPTIGLAAEPQESVDETAEAEPQKKSFLRRIFSKQ